MIKQLKLENFKCFNKETAFDLSKVNLFVGYNGRGKSTVIQSLLLLSQSVCHYGDLRTLEVNGDYIHLGLFEDLLNVSNDVKPIIKFSFLTDQKEGAEIFLGYEEKKDSERLGQICDLKADGYDYMVKSVASLDLTEKGTIEVSMIVDRYPNGVNTVFQNCNFISAERQGPTLFEEKRDISVYNPVGKKGENVLNYIAKNKGLRGEINRWVDYIMNGGDLSLKGNGKDSSVLSLNFSIPEGNNKKSFKAINCGFGYSYVLSIVVNALMMEKGTLIVENPEAHLHPLAQLRLTELLAKISNKNIQIFIETHSEHIINGFRIIALKQDFELSNEDLSIYFFDKDFSITHLKVESNGRIKNWPKGFFDQFEWEMTEIIKLGNQVKC